MANKSGRRRQRSGGSKRVWRRMDLHLHTPGSNDYQESGISPLDILRQAELRGLDIIAITDHNTVAGFAKLKREIEQLIWLEQLGRMEPDETRHLEEYRRLLDKILVLPGFEFTATFGFHILGIFPSETPVSYLEHLLLSLNVPTEALQEGSSTVGATSDVLTAYRIIAEAGGLVIGAHANTSNGVAMRGLDFGGQTRIAYTQDRNLHCLEVTDLEKRGRYTTRRFFDGSKPEYPRPMRCIQGSDSHRLVGDPSQPKSLGIGDRITEILLDEVTFEALTDVIKGNDFSRTRPYRGPANPVDFVQAAREEGVSIVQAFHASMAQRGGNLDRILQDICAMANTNGGTIYVGASANPRESASGVRETTSGIETLYASATGRISPEPEIEIDSLRSKGKQVVRIIVQPGRELPYAIDDSQFFVRDEEETSLAVRDEIVRLVERGQQQEFRMPITAPGAPPLTPTHPGTPQAGPPSPPRVGRRGNGRSKKMSAPRTGVEVVTSEKRKGTIYHTVRDLRNGNLIKNVTKSSARKLWHYAISQAEAGPLDAEKIDWRGDIAVLDQRRKGDSVWYDLAMREEGAIHVYYGVTDSGLNDIWLSLLGRTT